jgi:fatty acid desaturase
MYHGVELDEYLSGRMPKAEFKARRARALRKIRHQVVKDYVAYPLLALPLVPFVGWWAPLAVLAGTFVANVLRNIWTFLVIFCGHFPADVQTFEEDDAKGENRGQWYLRQMLGSANISGTPLFHVMTGNLSHQVEHHLFPDIPARRYPHIAPEVRDIAKRYGLPYNTGRFGRQLSSVARQLAVFGRKPNDPYLVAKSPESRALRRAKREEEVRRAEADKAARMAA